MFVSRDTVSSRRWLVFRLVLHLHHFLSSPRGNYPPTSFFTIPFNSTRNIVMGANLSKALGLFIFDSPDLCTTLLASISFFQARFLGTRR